MYIYIYLKIVKSQDNNFVNHLGQVGKKTDVVAPVKSAGETCVVRACVLD